MLTKKFLDNLTYKVIGAAIEVHKELGPGLLESVYHKCMLLELTERGLNYQSELVVPLKYKENIVETELRCDLLIENVIVVELKCVQEIHPVHKAQLLSYMKLLKKPKGILINFNVSNIFNEGQQTFVNEYFSELD